MLLSFFSNVQNLLAQNDELDILEKQFKIYSPDASFEKRINFIKKLNYQNLIIEKSSECVQVLLTEDQIRIRNILNKIIREKRKLILNTNKIADRSVGPARMRYYFDPSATSNRGGQSGCNSTAANATGIVNSRYVSAGFDPNQFILQGTDPVLIDQDWSNGSGNSGAELIIAFADWLDINYPSGVGEPHISVGVYGGVISDAGGVTLGAICGQTSFNCNGDNRSYIVVANQSILSNTLLPHEVGHNFSLPHNNSPDICPLGTGGNINNYLMSGGLGSTNWHSQSLTRLVISVNWNSAQNPDYPLFSGSILPLSLLSFSATADKDNSVLLSWQTAEEVGRDNMTLYRSTDAKDWEEIYQTTSVGNIGTHYYQYIDHDIYHDRYYYKLVVNDKEWIRVVSLQENDSEIKIFPNPTDELIFVKNPTDSPILVFDAIGRLIQSFENHNDITKIQLD